MFRVKFYMFFSPSDVTSLFAQSHTATNKAYRHLGTTAMFNMPLEAHEFIAADYTGKHPKSLPLPPGYPVTKPEHRFEYLVHSSMRKLLTGPGLKPLIHSYERILPISLSHQLKLDTTSATSHPDLLYILQSAMVETTACCMFGPQLLDTTPGLLGDFIEHDRSSTLLAKGLPKWMVSAAHSSKERCIQGFKNYHSMLQRDPVKLETTGNFTVFDESVVPELVKCRQQAWKKMEPMTSDAQASEDMALLWAYVFSPINLENWLNRTSANHNATNTVFWLLTRILSDKKVRARVERTLSEIESVYGPDPGPYILANSPYLQSLFAETLRFYSADMVLRGPSLTDTRVNNWIVPRGSYMGISTFGRHHDINAWNTGTTEETHSLDDFWDERFLVSEKQKLSGPSKHPAPRNVVSEEFPGIDSSTKNVSEKDVRFSTDGLAGTFIPFGGGDTMCPGRSFAKMEIIHTVVYFLKNYEIEFDGDQPEFAKSTFGVGILAPKSKLAVRIRKI